MFPGVFSRGIREGAGDESEAQQDYAQQAGAIAKRAKIALVNRQINELDKAMKTVAEDFQSADAQMVLAEAGPDAMPPPVPPPLPARFPILTVPIGAGRVTYLLVVSHHVQRHADTEETWRNLFVTFDRFLCAIPSIWWRYGISFTFRGSSNGCQCGTTIKSEGHPGGGTVRRVEREGAREAQGAPA